MKLKLIYHLSQQMQVGQNIWLKNLLELKFEGMIDSLVAETITKINEVVSDAGLKKDEIKEIVMVGALLVFL